MRKDNGPPGPRGIIIFRNKVTIAVISTGAIMRVRARLSFVFEGFSHRVAIQPTTNNKTSTSAKSVNSSMNPKRNGSLSSCVSKKPHLQLVISAVNVLILSKGQPKSLSCVLRTSNPSFRDNVNLPGQPPSVVGIY